MSQLLTLALCAALTLVAPPPQERAAELVREPESKVAFPLQIAPLGAEGQHELIGTGIRTKTIFKFEIYAIGLYVDTAGAQAELAPWKGRTARHLRKTKAFYKDFLRSSFAKTLRIVTTRDVDADDLFEGFEDALEPRIVEYEKKNRAKGGKVALKRLRGFFDKGELKAKSELLFTVHPGGRMVVSNRGKLRGEVVSPSLCWALFDSYLGTDPVSDSAKKTLVARLPAVLAMELPGRPAPGDAGKQGEDSGEDPSDAPKNDGE